MTLRVRLFLTILGTAFVVTPALLWLEQRQDRLATEKIVSEYALSMMADWGRTACLKRPATFLGGVAPRPTLVALDRGKATSRVTLKPSRFMGKKDLRTTDEVWAFRSTFVSDNELAPPFPEGLKEAVLSGDSVASEPAWITDDPREHVAVAIRTPWPDEPCAVLLVIHSSPRRPELSRDRTLFAVAQSAVLLLAVLLACLPIVRRVRELKDAVRQSAASRYALPISIGAKDEIGALAQAFDQAGVEIRKNLVSLERREATLRAFIANTTHDVMLPVTVLQGHLAEIKRRCDAGLPVDPQTLIACHREADYLTSILRNLAAVAKLEGADYEHRKDPLVLNQLVDRVVARYRWIAKIERVSLDRSVPAEDVEVLGDVTLLEQALGNVIHNAIRYNRAGGHVAVVLDLLSGRFSLRVIDDGPGIPQADLARLTERRFRGDAARARNPAGLGLGLHIASEVCVRHGFNLMIRRSEYSGLDVEFSGGLSSAAPVAAARGPTGTFA